MGCRGEMLEKRHARRLWVPSANHGTTPYETGSLQVVSRFNVESNAWRARGGRAMQLLALPQTAVDEHIHSDSAERQWQPRGRGVALW
jgi:hypothetical protein